MRQWRAEIRAGNEKRPDASIPAFRPHVAAAGFEARQRFGDQTRRAFSTRRVTTQFLVFEMGRVSAISTRSPILYSPFSSWAWYLRERPMILPYSSWITRRSTSTVMVFERLSLTTRPTRVRVFVSDFVVEAVAT